MAPSTVNYSSKLAAGLKNTMRDDRATSHAFVGSLILGSSDSASTSSGSNTSSRTGTPHSLSSQNCEKEVERCSCCSIDDFWKIYDSFCLMDKRHCGSVRRCDFHEAITEYVTLEMRRTMTRGDLHERFRSSAAELTLEELIGRVWPLVTNGDRKMIGHWAKLRDAVRVLSNSSFQGTREDLKRIFDILDVKSTQSLSMVELVRARILTKGESQKLLKDMYKAFSKSHSDDDSASDDWENDSMKLSFNEFCLTTQNHLTAKYVQKEDPSSWVAQWRSAYNTSKATTAKLKAVEAIAPFRSTRRFHDINMTIAPEMRISNPSHDMAGHVNRGVGNMVMAC